VVTSVLALGCGSLALTSLISGYSLVLPTVFGLILWEEPLYLTQVIGFAILVVSLYFANKRSAPAKAEGESEADKISVKWLVYVSLMFLSNGGCAISQQMQQNKFSEVNGYAYDFKNEFMFVALIVVVLLFAGIGLWRERRDLGTVLRLGTLPAVLTGVCNGVTNLLVMIVVGVSISAAVFFPVISAGGLVISYVISVLFFKERFSGVQKLGILLGLVSVILLNLSFVQLL
jgi:drug/metabolite transporter (DMT)-like permease